MEDDGEAFITAQSILSVSLSFVSLVPLFGMVLYPIISKSIKEDKQMDFPENANSFNWIFYCGAMFGLICCILFESTKLSRKKMLISTTLISLLGWICMFFSPNYSMLLFGRILAGITMGIQSVAIYYCTAECIYPTQFRNMALLRHSTDFYIGVLLIAYVGEIIPWRYVILFGILLHLFVCFLLVDIQETPYFLLLKKEKDRAFNAFNNLVPVDSQSARKAFNRIIIQVRKAQERNIDIGFTLYNSNLYMKTTLIIGYELSEVLVYYYYFPQLAGKEKFVVVISCLIFMMWMPEVSVMRNDWNLDRCRYLLKVIIIIIIVRFILLIYFVQNNQNCYINVWTMLIYFLLYTNGWLCSHHILLDDNTSYHKNIILIAPLLLCKFTAATFILMEYDPFKIEEGSFSIFCGLIEMLLVFFISIFSFEF